MADTTAISQERVLPLPETNRHRTYKLDRGFENACAIKGYEKTEVLTSDVTFDGLQQMSVLRLSPHLLTHMDMLGRIDWNDDDVRKVYSVSEQAKVNLQKVATVPQVYPCVIITLPTYVKTMTEVCAKRKWPKRLDVTGRLVDWEADEYYDVVEKLRISGDFLKQLNLPQNHFVLFHTDWQQFAPASNMIPEQVKYPFHPYLMRPFLDAAAARHLIGLNVKGVGSDTGGLDCVLRYCEMDAWQNGTRPPGKPDWLSDERKRPDDLVETVSVGKRYRYDATHLEFLSRGLPLIENLVFPGDILWRFGWQSRENKALCSNLIFGTLMTVPVNCKASKDACLVSVFLKLSNENGVYDEL